MPPVQSATRQRIACKHCNSRRVRCDRSPSGAACSNCIVASVTCELIESKRGKYKKSRQKLNNYGHITNRSDSSPAIAVDNTMLSPADSRKSEQASHRTRDQNRYVSPSLPEFVIDKKSGNPSGKVVYMGDSGNMKYVIHEVGDPFKASSVQSTLWGDNLQRFMMEKLGRTTKAALQTLRTDDERCLQELGVFQFPEKNISDEIVRVFFECSYPVFPIFNKTEFMTTYASGCLSPLVLNAIYCVGVKHCSDSLLASLGFTTRYLACYTFYRRAKALFDRDFESDCVATIQATTMLVNWWGGPMDQKDPWYWIGVATSLAQSLGMHRAKSYSILPPLQLRLWRRIWWVLFINDIHHAAVFGRPPHIHSQFCDVKMLTEDDMLSDAPGTSLETENGLYLVHLAQLSSVVSSCLIAKFSPEESSMSQVRYQELLDFESTLSYQFRVLPSHISHTRGFWPCIFQLQYWDYLIVFHRMLSDATDNGATFAIAAKISRALEDMLASGKLYNAPFLIFPAIFCSILVHIIHIRKGDVHMRFIAEHRARLAMHILENFQDAWPMVVWTRGLLDVLLKGSSTSSIEPFEQPPQSQQRAPEAANSTFGSNRLQQHDESPPETQAAAGEEESSPEYIPDRQAQTQSQSLRSDPHPLGGDFNMASMPLMFPFESLVQDIGFSSGLWGDDYHNLEDFL